MQQKLPLKFIRINSQGENIEWIFLLIEKYEKNERLDTEINFCYAKNIILFS